MTSTWILYSAVVAASRLSFVAAQDQAETCYGPGSVVGAVLGTFILTLAFLFGSHYVYKEHWRSRKSKHLELMKDAENPNDQFAFDNPCFREATPIKRKQEEEKLTSKLEKNKWMGWTPLSFGKEQKNEKVTSKDDSCVTDSKLKVVTLKSHDFTGLGFNICGNMRDGIFVKDVLHRGPAFESGCISSGDRIDSLCISFRNMVFEDALSILSYASPYDVQIQVENDAHWKPSTLLRSKRESNAMSSTERISHPKFNRSQSVSHLNEIGKSSNKKSIQTMDITLEKNRINHSLNKFQDHPYVSNECPAINCHQRKESQKLEKTSVTKFQHFPNEKIILQKEEKDAGPSPSKTMTGESPNKLQKLGIKVLPINVNPKMGIQSVTGAKKVKDESRIFDERQTETESNLLENFLNCKHQEAQKDFDEADANKENAKGMLTKGLQNLKGKLNQNSLGKKRKKDSGHEFFVEEKGKDEPKTRVPSEVVLSGLSSDTDHPTPRTRSSVSCGTKAYENNQQSHSLASAAVPEEVSRAGDVARNNRKSITETSLRKSLSNFPAEFEEDNHFLTSRNIDVSKKIDGSDSDGSSEKNSFGVSEEEKRPKKNKGKAPLPPPTGAKGNKPQVLPKTSIVTGTRNEIEKESELVIERNVNRIKPKTDEISKNWRLLESDSDTEEKISPRKNNFANTKIELNSTEITVHQSSSDNSHEEDKEPNRKAASLGDLSKLDSEQPLSIVLERAVSLDLTEGSVQSGKKRKAPLPPPEEFPAVFDDYKKEPRLDTSLTMNTFQRRLKKSSDFGTLEDVLNEGPKSLEVQINKNVTPLDLTEAHNNNIQEFSTWLAECRKPKGDVEELISDRPKGSTSLININPSDCKSSEKGNSEQDYRESRFCFSVNGKNFPNMEMKEKTFPDSQNADVYAGTNSKTVVVISQPNSLEPVVLESLPEACLADETFGKGTDYLEARDWPTSSTDEDPRSRSSFQGRRSDDRKEIPPKLPNSPVPSNSETLSSPLSSSLTYITEIKVSTSEQSEGHEFSPLNGLQTSLSRNNETGFRDSEFSCKEESVEEKPEFVTSIRQKIEKFDPKSSFANKTLGTAKSDLFADASNRAAFFDGDIRATTEISKTPLKVMKSETGQRVLATIQSLAAKESVSKKTPEIECAKRVASIISGAGQKNRTHYEATTNDDTSPPTFTSGLYFETSGTSPSKPSKDYSPTRKVPPVVPPRKMETFLSTRPTNQGTREGNPDALAEVQEKKFSFPEPNESEKPNNSS